MIEGYEVVFRAVTEDVARDWSFGAVARNEGSGRPFELLQMFLPDAAGRFPWDADVDLNYLRVQGKLLPLMAHVRN